MAPWTVLIRPFSQFLPRPIPTNTTQSYTGRSQLLPLTDRCIGRLGLSVVLRRLSTKVNLIEEQLAQINISVSYRLMQPLHQVEAALRRALFSKKLKTWMSMRDTLCKCFDPMNGSTKTLKTLLRSHRIFFYTVGQ